MANVTVTVQNGAGVFLKNMRESLPKALEAGVLRAAQEAAGELRRQVFDTFPQGRTGQLARSFRETFLGRNGNEVSAGAFSDSIYARIQDEGGTIKPRNRQYLAVPVGAGRSLPVGKWPRHFGKGELAFIARKGRDPLLARVTAGGIVPLFVLKRSVTLRGRAYIEAAGAKAAPRMANIIADAAAGAADKATE